MFAFWILSWCRSWSWTWCWSWCWSQGGSVMDLFMGSVLGWTAGSGIFIFPKSHKKIKKIEIKSHFLYIYLIDMHKRCSLSHFCENSLTLVCGICYLRWTKWADEGILHFWKSHKCQICKIHKSQMYQLKTFPKFPPNSSVRLNWLDAATAQHGIPQPPGEKIF